MRRLDDVLAAGDFCVPTGKIVVDSAEYLHRD
jgi:hypothetical protein